MGGVVGGYATTEPGSRAFSYSAARGGTTEEEWRPLPGNDPPPRPDLVFFFLCNIKILNFYLYNIFGFNLFQIFNIFALVIIYISNIFEIIIFYNIKF